MQRVSAIEGDLNLAIPGLLQAASIQVDRWGIAHLHAKSTDDLWFVQGFNAARDRLWQIDLWRKRGLGLLAADFGPGYLEQDRAARMFLYRGDMDAEWAAYAPDSQVICTRFAAGINAYIALSTQQPEMLPPEFAILGTRPTPWQAEDVVRIRSHGLTRNALWEVQRLQVLGKSDAATDLLRKFLYPSVETSIPAGITPGDCPIEALAMFRLAQANVTFSPERLAATLEEAGKWRLVSDLNEVFVDPEYSGSNNWIVHGSRTKSGMPILASDPHRAHSLPSLRYIVHLNAPGFDAIGAGEPCVPGISLGHNGEASFGLTIFGADQEDTYVLETDPAAPNLYRFNNAWEAMREIVEFIPVKGYPDQRHLMQFSRQGPVLWRNAARTRAVSVRSVWFEPGSAPYLQSLSIMRARTKEAFRASAENWGTPSSNLIYADQGGTIAWSPGGFLPYRLNWKGLTPVPGDGSHEWDGFIEGARMPFVVNPERGYFATANEMNLPADWPHDAFPVGFEWTEGSRAVRIHEALDAEPIHTIEAAASLQCDTFSVPARRCCALLAAIENPPVGLADALALFKGWNYRLEASSSPAALFELWWSKHLKPALFAQLVPDAAIRAIIGPGDVEGICQVLENPDARWGESPKIARNALLATSLASAFADAIKRLGADAAQWQWGTLHHGYFEHMLSPLMQNNPQRSLDIGPLAKGGSSSTPMHAGYRADFRITTGASFRMVVDFSNLDQSLTINAPGQSGDPRSSHYADLAPLWASGQYVPMLYSPAAIEANTHFTWQLSPI